MYKYDFQPLVDDFIPTGSRVICNPAPKDTDEDWACYTNSDQFLMVRDKLIALGYQQTRGEYVGKPAVFLCFRRGELNIIMTDSYSMYLRFKAATSVAKRLNLLKKSDRVALFQAVLYGEISEE